MNWETISEVNWSQPNQVSRIQERSWIYIIIVYFDLLLVHLILIILAFNTLTLRRLEVRNDRVLNVEMVGMLKWSGVHVNLFNHLYDIPLTSEQYSIYHCSMLQTHYILQVIECITFDS